MMKTLTTKQRILLLKTGTVVLSLLWTATVLGVNIQLGGGGTLDLSTFQVIHQETFDSDQSPETIFWGALDIGEKTNDPWIGMLTKGVYALTHTGKPGAARYYFRHFLDQTTSIGLSAFPLSVEISGTINDEISGAGLLYAFDPQTKHYLAFVKGDGASYAIYKRNAEGLNRLMGGTSEAVRPQQTNQLAIVPDGSKINFYINGTHVAAIKDETAASGGAGLMAISSGMFLFDNFTIYQSPQPNASPSVSGQNKRATEAGVPAQADERTATPVPVEEKPAQASETQKKTLRSYKDSLKIGMSKQQVIQMFGPGWERGTRLFYDLGSRSLGVDIDTLIIEFDGDDKLVQYRVSRG